MFKILKKEALNPTVSKMELSAPEISRSVKAGQFIILRVDEKGERIPLTVFDCNPEKGSIEIIYQKVGTSTLKLDKKCEGEQILDLVGPLGKPTHIEEGTKAIVVAGGVGTAVAYPIAKEIKNKNGQVRVILGFRNKDLIILDGPMKQIDASARIVTDDGSNGDRGFVTDALSEELSKNPLCDIVIAIGPIPMMNAVCKVTQKYKVKTIVSMNSIMVDGTGMCGGCRLKVDGKIKFACIDGPDFDGHKVDFEEASIRNRNFIEEETKSREKYCNLFKGV